uniref:Alpha-1,2-fucosyltransferase n=1 Tax=Nucleocytoviricota sp. TaxID=2809609 RepID=A0A9E8GAV3_9VIRU|nr:alpha-1,2-fucosyltransferase [Nucleocytoviricota sp.]UZT29318.1 alpha-1,2-fucosyltransferase [Nucleocytoviricota sp.]
MNNNYSIIINGGLGNQLFQIFTLINYCIENSGNYLLPLNLPSWEKKRYTYWDTFFYELRNNIVNNDVINNYDRYIESEFNYNKIPVFLTNKTLQGYYQSELYFKKNFEHICSILKIREKQNIIKKYKKKLENTISLHFRMGDYIGGCSDIIPIIPDIYYINSIKFIIKNKNIINWNIFYANEKVDENIVLQRINNINKHFNNLNFIKISNELTDWEQLIFMSLCENNIIANSTFSWWSAYLNQNKSKVVCYPSLWFGKRKNLNLENLFPTNWNKIFI